MLLVLIGHRFHYEMENLCRVFFPDESIQTVTAPTEKQAITVTTALSQQNPPQVSVHVAYYEKETQATATVTPRQEEPLDTTSERVMAQQLFLLLVDLTGYRPPWGILTGVRPSKLMHKLMQQYGKQGAQQYFLDTLYVSPEKTALAQTVAEEEAPILAASRPESFSLYVAIPFCPSRCSYCSFVSHSITNRNAQKLLPEYIDNLCKELAETGSIVRQLGLTCESVYFGGGTPSVLSAMDLARLHQEIAKHFDLSTVREYTVEAGRPETLNAEKLHEMHTNGVTRISINPQTFHVPSLQAIGREHTVADVQEAYRLAREAKIPVINMDVIAGLPADTVESFGETVHKIIDMNPENITLHTLARKRASAMAQQNSAIQAGETVQAMLQRAQEQFSAAQYRPYYMYRQSRCVGNLENVGWCKGNTACVYNIYMMEECHTVLACGAGAVTKLKEPHGEHLTRIFNFKYPYEYNRRFPEMLARKQGILDFYRA